MFLSKKDTPKGFNGMWYAGALNLAVCYFNIIMYNLNGGQTMTLVSCTFSLIVSIIIFTFIKRMTTQMLWDRLTKASKSGEDSMDPGF